MAHVLEQLSPDTVGVAQRRNLLLGLREPHRGARRCRLLAVQTLELGVGVGERSRQCARLDDRTPPQRCDSADRAAGHKEDDEVEDVTRVGETETVDRRQEEVVGKHG